MKKQLFIENTLNVIGQKTVSVVSNFWKVPEIFFIPILHRTFCTVSGDPNLLRPRWKALPITD